jgi:hypothetical protein
MPGPLAGFPQHPEVAKENARAERLLMGAWANAWAEGRERPVSPSRTRIPRILLPIDWPVLVAWT